MMCSYLCAKNEVVVWNRVAGVHAEGGTLRDEPAARRDRESAPPRRVFCLHALPIDGDVLMLIVEELRLSTTA